MKVIYLKGLPASGKSTWARQYLAESNNTAKRVNKDLLRLMYDDGIWSKTKESRIVKTERDIAEDILKDGYDLIVDNTGLAKAHEDYYRELAKKYGAEFEVKWFTTSMEQCIIRDKKRPAFVTEKVIRNMWKEHEEQLLANGVAKYGVTDIEVVYIPPKGKPYAIIVDLDGTLAHIAGDNPRSPYEWLRVGEDVVDAKIANLVDLYSADDSEIIILSGRDSICRKQTEKWLMDNFIEYDHLFMRKKGDQRKDSIIKKELFETHIRDNFQIEVVIDDRAQVVNMWRNELGLKTLQVADGYF